MGFAEDLDAGLKGAVCGWLGEGGGSAILGSAVVAGLRVPGGQVPSLAAGLGLLALNAGCSFDPNKGYPPADLIGFSGCLQAPPGGVLELWYVDATGGELLKLAMEFQSISKAQVYNRAQDEFFYDLDGVSWDGLPINWRGIRASLAGAYGLKGKPRGGPCPGSAPEFGGDLPPFQFTTPGGCQLNIGLDSWLVDGDGTVRPVVKVSPSSAVALASGGVIGGCNFNTLVYVGGGGGGQPPWYAPWVDGPDGPDGKPWWWDPLIKGATGLVDAVFEKWIEDLLTPSVPAALYRLTSVCEVNSSGEPVDQAVEVQIPAGKGLGVIAQRLDALAEIAQGLKDFKQPVCPADTGPAVLEGLEHTLRFVSIGKSPLGDNPLRKEFRYRTLHIVDPETHRNHWKDFEWRSGPWVVLSIGAPWGKPQVWAETPEEGERVLRHAAAIAGVDLDAPKHRFKARQTSSWRQGVVMTMRPLRMRDGGPWLTTRNGPSGYPQAV